MYVFFQCVCTVIDFVQIFMLGKTGQSEKMDVSDFMGDGDHILGNTAASVMKTYDCCTESYQDITFTLTISDDAV